MPPTTRKVRPHAPAKKEVPKKSGVTKRRKKSASSGKKKPLTPYFRFAKDYRSKHANELKGMKIPDQGRYLGKKWRALTDSQKAAFGKTTGDISHAKKTTHAKK